MKKIFNLQNKYEKRQAEIAGWVFLCSFWASVFFVFSIVFFSIPIELIDISFLLILVLAIQIVDMIVNHPYKTSYKKACKDCVWYKRTINSHICTCPELYYMAVDNTDTKHLLGEEWKPQYTPKMSRYANDRCECVRGTFHETESCGENGDWWTSIKNYKGENNG